MTNRIVRSPARLGAHRVRYRQGLAIVSVALLIVGCATPYQPRGVVGGYTDQVLANDRFLISVLGNAYTTVGEVEAHFHRRAVEIVQSNHYAGYVVESIDARVKPWSLGPRPQADGVIHCYRDGQPKVLAAAASSHIPTPSGVGPHRQSTVSMSSSATAQTSLSPTLQGPSDLTPPLPPVVRKFPGKGFRTRIDDDADDVLVLRNGAIVELTSGYFGGVPSTRDVILYSTGFGWRIWVERRKSYRCELLREPSTSRTVSIQESLIENVSSNGRIVTLMDGTIWEISSIDHIESMLWLPFADVIIIDDAEIATVDDGSIASATRLK